jgi:hypothetical protein
MENSIQKASLTRSTPDFIQRNFLLVYFHGTAESTEYFFHSHSQKLNKSRHEGPPPLQDVRISFLTGKGLNQQYFHLKQQAYS